MAKTVNIIMEPYITKVEIYEEPIGALYELYVVTENDLYLLESNLVWGDVASLVFYIVDLLESKGILVGDIRIEQCN